MLTTPLQTVRDLADTSGERITLSQLNHGNSGMSGVAAGLSCDLTPNHFANAATKIAQQLRTEHVDERLIPKEERLAPNGSTRINRSNFSEESNLASSIRSSPMLQSDDRSDSRCPVLSSSPEIQDRGCSSQLWGASAGNHWPSCISPRRSHPRSEAERLRNEINEEKQRYVKLAEQLMQREQSQAAMKKEQETAEKRRQTIRSLCDEVSVLQKEIEQPTNGFGMQMGEQPEPYLNSAYGPTALVNDLYRPNQGMQTVQQLQRTLRPESLPVSPFQVQQLSPHPGAFHSPQVTPRAGAYQSPQLSPRTALQQTAHAGAFQSPEVPPRIRLAPSGRMAQAPGDSSRFGSSRLGCDAAALIGGAPPVHQHPMVPNVQRWPPWHVNKMISTGPGYQHQ